NTMSSIALAMGSGRTSSIALLFHNRGVVAVGSSGAVELAQLDWTRVEAGDVTAAIVEPLLE
ncbi:hypothetical protein, partial [Morganella morganii]|uniref:hypothetical protein n=1 Tax=Morganella morganii TaxID=582 RepID=UPI001952DFDE